MLSSIIFSLAKDNRNELFLNYGASSYVNNHQPEHAIGTNNNIYYKAANGGNPWWSITFSRPVIVEEYQIGCTIFGNGRPREWTIQFLDEKNRLVRSQPTSYNIDKVTKFSVNKTPCSTIKIIFTRTSDGISGGGVIFNSFDCFGSLVPYPTPTPVPKRTPTKKLVNCKCNSRFDLIGRSYHIFIV